MITAVHLGCKNVTISMDPKKSKGTFLGKARVWTDTSVPLFIKQSGGTKKGTSASTVLVLVYWIWLWLVGKSGARGGWRDVFVMQGRGRRRGLYKVFVLTAVMHGVAGDNHR